MSHLAVRHELDYVESKVRGISAHINRYPDTPFLRRAHSYCARKKHKRKRKLIKFRLLREGIGEALTNSKRARLMFP